MKSLLLVLLTLIATHSQVRGQHSDWVVRYFDGTSGTLISLDSCRLATLTPETLYVDSRGNGQGVRLFLLKELSRPNEDHDFLQPIWMGALIGGAFGLAVSSFVGDESSFPDNKDHRPEITAIFALIGGGLGLEKSFDSKYVRHRFAEISNPQKRDMINAIMEEEKKHFDDGGQHIDIRTKKEK